MKSPLIPSGALGAILAASLFSAAQTAAKPATAAKSTAPAKAAVSAMPGALPPGIPRVRGIMKTAFSLRYEDVKIGTGADAEPNKLYKVLYTGYLAADGHKFDSSEDHRLPLRDADGKPILGDDGKPKLGDPEPITFPQGFGRVIPGFDQGFSGMKVGGKRRLFIPWQLAYGAHGHPGPDAAHPGIPQKADLIFDIELVGISDMQMPQGRPGMPTPGSAPRPATPTPNPSATAPPTGSATQPATPQSTTPADTKPAQPAASQPSTTPQPQTPPQK